MCRVHKVLNYIVGRLVWIGVSCAFKGGAIGFVPQQLTFPNVFSAAGHLLVATMQNHSAHSKSLHLASRKITQTKNVSASSFLLEEIRCPVFVIVNLTKRACLGCHATT